MASPSGTWTLLDFEDRYDRWVEIDGQDDDLRLEVLAWLVGRQDDPYQGVKPDPRIPGLYYGTIPHTEVDGRAVLCSYWIFNDQRQVRMDSLATLALPH